ncbi:MAG: sugar phosphate nucleotidyltransferase [Patescibacteria group bacterium]
MVSTVVIMAAGRGTRMKDLASDKPKHLLPVLGRPFLDYTLDRLRQAGFTDLVILIGHNGHTFSMYKNVPDIRLAEQHRFHERYGTAAAVENVKSAVGGKPFAVIAGDNLYSVNDLRKMTRYDGQMIIGGYRTPQWQGMGILKQKPDGTLDKIIEKPTEFVGDLINASLYLFTPAIFPIIEQLQPSPRGEYEITDAINVIAGREAVEVVALEDRWLDLTAPTDIPKIEAALQTTT